jgi:glutamyl-tRNA reductase
MSALLRRGDEVVEQVLRRNQAHWESLSSADRERLEALLQEVASRLLQEAVLRLETSQGEQSFQYARALREPSRRTPPLPVCRSSTTR